MATELPLVETVLKRTKRAELVGTSFAQVAAFRVEAPLADRVNAMKDAGILPEEVEVHSETHLTARLLDLLAAAGDALTIALNR